MPGAVQDVITLVNLRGFGVARGRILAFSIDLLRRLKNTRTVVCDKMELFLLSKPLS